MAAVGERAVDSVGLSVPSREPAGYAAQLTMPDAATVAATRMNARPMAGENVRFGMNFEEGGNLPRRGSCRRARCAGEALRKTVLPAVASKVQTSGAMSEQRYCAVL